MDIREISIPEVDYEAYSKKLLLKGCDAKLFDLRWIKNHLDLILWKMLSTLERFPSFEIYSLGTIEKAATDQLLYRYEREINRAQRSVLKTVCEGDDTPMGLFVLCIKDICPGQIQLADGWYSLWSLIDKPIDDLIQRGKLRIGQKLLISNLTLVKNEPIAVLEADEADQKLKVGYNSIAPCKWHRKLGRQKAKTFNRPLCKVLTDGGSIPCIEVVVVKRYPDIVVVTLEDGKVVEKSKREWEALLNHPDGQDNRPVSASKSVRLICADVHSNIKASVKLCNVPEEMCGKLVNGRILQILNGKPIASCKMLDLRVYQAGRQCLMKGINDGFKDSSQLSPLELLSNGEEYDICMKIVRHNLSEAYIWGLTSSNLLVSIGTGHFKSCMPRFTTGELVIFRNLEYLYHDGTYNFEVFGLGVVSDWERGAIPVEVSKSFEDAASGVYEGAISFVDGLVSGKFNRNLV